MTDSMFNLSRQLARSLRNLDSWIDVAREHAASKRFDPEILLQMRLAPDMFPLVWQICTASDNAKLMSARLTGKTAPVHGNTEPNWEAVRARLAETIAWIESLQPEDFEGAADRRATFGWLPGKFLPGETYFVQYAIPNFHFHLTTAYAILRHNGVPLGKGHYLGALPFEEA